jgi:GNAT superfamily N-acetyltransferase
MTQTYFVDAHNTMWSDAALTMTRDYFSWMNDQMQATCNFSIEDITGMPMDMYITKAMNIISPKDRTNAAFYLLVLDGAPIAMGGLRQLPSGNGEVVRIYTKPENRGHGYGSKVLEKLILEAKSRGFKTLNLDTGVFMKNAQSMYMSHGFETCDPYEGAEPPSQLLPYWLYMQLNLELDRVS